MQKKPDSHEPIPMDTTISTVDFAPQPEESKSRQDKGEDVAYTINHALACTATDLIDPYVGKWTQKYLNRRVSIGCGEDHGHDSSTAHNWIGEVVGDFGAVPLTIFVQRKMPFVMDAVRYAAEPILGDFFRHGAKEAARDRAMQAMEEGKPYSAEAYRAHAKEIYRYEMQHLPQGLMWTASSIGLNIATQKAIGNPSPVGHILAGKVTGSAISTGLLFGIRGAAPETAHRWDQFATGKVLIPATKVLGKLFGVHEKDIESMAQKKEALENSRWAGHVREQKEQAPADHLSMAR
ncbi:MAG: hypothetical protein DI582_02690 [Azospirillum brasilense]|nr:MAG: hypothetical protein DI582_02690 [Azospirillum brasilense]